MTTTTSPAATAQFRVFKQVPRILFGTGALERLSELLPARGTTSYVYVIDDVFKGSPLWARLKTAPSDRVVWFDAKTKEPSTAQVDRIRDEVAAGGAPAAVIGIGGGSTMDVAKALSVMLNHEGSSSQYQGWDLLQRAGVFKVGVPTVSGSGSEASRTAVLMGKDKKFGINSDWSMFDAIVLDSSLVKGVPADQRFHSGMDCYIHCVESMTGTMINELSRAYADRGLELCRKVFLGEGTDDDLMVASFMGGCSIVNSEVGVCHALSYGLSLELGYRHGFANCVAFDVLEEYYGPYVTEFRSMLKRQGVTWAKGAVRKLDGAAMDRMVAMTLKMERPLTNALGPDFRDKLTPAKIKALYERM